MTRFLSAVVTICFAASINACSSGGEESKADETVGEDTAAVTAGSKPGKSPAYKPNFYRRPVDAGFPPPPRVPNQPWSEKQE